MMEKGQSSIAQNLWHKFTGVLKDFLGDLLMILHFYS